METVNALLHKWNNVINWSQLNTVKGYNYSVRRKGKDDPQYSFTAVNQGFPCMKTSYQRLHFLFLSFAVTQLSATSASRAAFLHCLRWGTWCPFQEPAEWKGEEIQLVLQGGAKPNPYGAMVYSTEASAKTQGPAPISAPGAAQVIQQHRRMLLSKGGKCKEFTERCLDKMLLLQPPVLTTMLPWIQKLSHYLYSCLSLCKAPIHYPFKVRFYHPWMLCSENPRRILL